MEKYYKLKDKTVTYYDSKIGLQIVRDQVVRFDKPLSDYSEARYRNGAFVDATKEEYETYCLKSTKPAINKIQDTIPPVTNEDEDAITTSVVDDYSERQEEPEFADHLEKMLYYELAKKQGPWIKIDDALLSLNFGFNEKYKGSKEFKKSVTPEMVQSAINALME